MHIALIVLISLFVVCQMVSCVLEMIDLYNHYFPPDRKWRLLKQYIHKIRKTNQSFGTREIDSVLKDIEEKMTVLEEED